MDIYMKIEAFFTSNPMKPKSFDLEHSIKSSDCLNFCEFLKTPGSGSRKPKVGSKNGLQIRIQRPKKRQKSLGSRNFEILFYCVLRLLDPVRKLETSPLKRRIVTKTFSIDFNHEQHNKKRIFEKKVLEKIFPE